jgi:L-fuculose-phosphate aldolase
MKGYLMAIIAEQIVNIARTMFERHLTDMAGGNLSARDGDTVYITPRFSGSNRHWQLDPEDILSGPLEGDDLLNHPLFSREGKAHLAIYRNFPNCQAVIHAHAFHIQPFAVAEKPIPPVMEATEKFGTINVVKYAPAHSADLADYIVEGLFGQDDRIQKQAAAVLMPRHGIMVAGKDLFSAVDALERIDTNCWCIMAQRLIGD